MCLWVIGSALYYKKPYLPNPATQSNYHGCHTYQVERYRYPQLTCCHAYRKSLDIVGHGSILIILLLTWRRSKEGKKKRIERTSIEADL